MRKLRDLFVARNSNVDKRLAEEIQILRNSRLIDPVWYRRTYSDLSVRPIDVARHYLEYGAAEMRNPHPLFDTRFYLEQNPDVAALGINPLVHYILSGAREGRDPLPLFDTKYYVEQVSALQGDGGNPLSHYLTVGWKRGFRPHRFFDPQWYLEQNVDVRAKGVEPLRHYLHWGWREGRRPSPLIDLTVYRKRYGLSGDINPLLHLALFGERAAELPLSVIEKRIAHFIAAQSSYGAEKMQASAYAKFYPDVAASKYNAEGLLDHWQRYGCKEGRTPFGYRPYKTRRLCVDCSSVEDIHYYGFFDAPNGMGSAARGYLSALRKTGFQVSPVTVSLINATGTFDTPPDSRSASPKNSSSAVNLNIFHINADMVNNFFGDGRRHLLDDSYNIGVWVWELAHFRPDWASAFGAMDEIWVPSEFCRSAISTISPIPVYTIPHIVEMQQGGAILPRSYFRIPDNVFVFACIFDIGSSIERKNPEAAIRAFIKAFGDRNDVLLVVKYHEIRYDIGGLAPLHALAAGRKNIRFFGRTFSERENISFKNPIDCFVSPHRSEGFGLNIAEALLLEKPVIATNYSSNVDFMDEENGFPLNFRLVEVGKLYGSYVPEALWAEPDLDDLVSKLRVVIEHPKTSSLRAHAARERISANYSAARIGEKIKSRLDELGISDRKLRLPVSRGAGVNYTYSLPEGSGPKISIVVPEYNTEPCNLLRCIYSIIAQTYQNWELILHENGSQRVDTLAAVNRFKGLDTRIKLSFGEKHVGIANATNIAIGLSSGEFIGFLDSNDELACDALAAIAEAINANDDADLLYSDEDKIDSDGNYCDHHYKPDWSPEYLESVMYLSHFVVIRRSIFLAVGGMRGQYNGAQDYDLVLRASRVARRVVHIPKVLYHSRKIPQSAAADVAAQLEALKNGEEALQDHLDASGRRATVYPGFAPGFFRVRDAIQRGLPVTLVVIAGNRAKDIPGRGTVNVFDNFLNSILEKTQTSCSLRILVADDGNFTESQRSQVLQNNGEVVSYDRQGLPFNYSRKVNFALKHVKTDLFILLNDDMEVISADWVDALIELAQRPTTGVVGARLLYPDDRVQHCGMVLGINGHSAHIYHQGPADLIGYNGYTHIIRNYITVTGACIATRMTLIDEVGGFDEALPVDYNDTDFCLKLYAAGYRNIYTPFAQLYHFEGTSFDRTSPNPDNHSLFVERWKKYMDRDPYYNVNLSRTRLDFALRSE